MPNAWEKLGCPKHILAPMVDASELAWRLLSRKHGAHVCYTPMFHSTVFARDCRYRKENFQLCSEDRPLVVQFCANDADILLKAAKFAEPFCDAIDINLGCPQAIAKRGHYGAFLQDEWNLLSKMVSTLRNNLEVPVTCKIRVFKDIKHTIAYAKMLEAAGCQLLTVHGRTRDQKGPLTGLASWEHIKAVRENVSIPVISNGNILCFEDIERCLQYTGCKGVMSAEGNLYNPGIFEGKYPPTWEIALEYLDLVVLYPCPISFTRGHLFKLLHALFALPENFEFREGIAKGQSWGEFHTVILKIKEKYIPFHEGTLPYIIRQTEPKDYNVQLPPWLCQPHIRISPEEHLKKLEDIKNRCSEGDSARNEKENINDSSKRNQEDGSQSLSKKKLKKLQRNGKITFHSRRTFDKCSTCPNPVGLKCAMNLCKACCKTKCYLENLDCVGHRILTKTRRENSKKRKNSQEIDDVKNDLDSVPCQDNSVMNLRLKEWTVDKE